MPNSTSINILIVCHWEIGWHSDTLYRAYAKRLGGVNVVTAPCNKEFELKADCGYQLHLVPFANGIDFAKGFKFWQLLKTVRRFNPDVIFAVTEPFYSYALQLAWMKRLGLIRAKIIFYGFENLSIGNGKRARFLIKPLWKYLDAGAIASTEAIETLYGNGFPKDHPLELIPFGTDMDQFYPRGKNASRLKFGVKGDKVIGFIGRLVDEKGIGDLIDSVKKLGKYNLCLVGGGPLLTTIEERLKSDPDLAERCQLLGMLPGHEVQELISAFDVLALPSRSTPNWKEQYGRVLAEAMASNVPVVGSDSGAIPEVIGDAGLVFPEGDVDALTQSLEKVLDNPQLALEFQRRGLERAREKLSFDVMTRLTVELAQRITSKN